ncbi:MAG: HYR domain-containing protein [Armatimonadia bacterium]|nr:HYR domain-containing protein [Armatimonadia bacterium]
MRVHGRALLVLCLLLAVSGAALAEGPLYAVTHVPSLGGLRTIGTDMNNDGMVTGGSQPGPSPMMPFVWSEDGGHTVLQDGDDTERINSSGVVCGTRRIDGGSSWLPLVWKDPTSPVEIAPGELEKGWAWDVTDGGTVVGSCVPNNASGSRPFIWSEADGLRLLEYPTIHDNGIAVGINEAGVVIGGAGRSAVSMAVGLIWRGNGPEPLPTLGQDYALAMDINEAMALCGEAEDAAGNHVPAYWANPDSAPLPLPIPSTHPKGRARDLNEHGAVAGWVASDLRYPLAPPNLAVAWIREELVVLQDHLDASGDGWLLTDARTINDHGQVLCVGQYNDMVWQTCILTPYPVAAAGEDMTVEQESLSGSGVTLDASASTGVGITYEWSENGETIATGPAPSVTLQLGTHEITLTVTDKDGRTDTDTVTIVVEDTTAPAISVTTPDPFEQSSADGTMVSVSVEVTDACDADPDVTYDPPIGGVFPLGTTEVTITAVDDSGNTAETTVSVEVQDTTPPSITAPADLTIQTEDPNGVALTDDDLGLPAVSDVCDAAPQVGNDAPGAFPIGVTVVTWTATDASGNVSTDQQTVTVELIAAGSPFDQLREMILGYVDSGDIDRRMQRSLIKKVDNAERQYDRGKVRPAKNMLGALANHIEAQAGKKISPEAAEALLMKISEIVAGM